MHEAARRIFRLGFALFGFTKKHFLTANLKELSTTGEFRSKNSIELGSGVFFSTGSSNEQDSIEEDSSFQNLL